MEKLKQTMKDELNDVIADDRVEESNFCTLFDINYIATGLTLYESLLKNVKKSVLWVVCMDSDTYDKLESLSLDRLKPVKLETIEAHFPELRQAKLNRSKVEYYFTCKSAILRFLFEVVRVENAAYVDADMYFFNDFAHPRITDCSTIITPHLFPHSQQHLDVCGKFNAGFVSVQASEVSFRLLRKWYEDCIEWCYDRIENGKYGDQKYLDQWKIQFDDVYESCHENLNVGPWNVGGKTVGEGHETVTLNGNRLICFHFHGLKKISAHKYELGVDHYDIPNLADVVNAIYIPYMLARRRVENKYGVLSVQKKVREKAAKSGILWQLRLMVSRLLRRKYCIDMRRYETVQ